MMEWVGGKIFADNLVRTLLSAEISKTDAKNLAARPCRDKFDFIDWQKKEQHL